jgi:excisionase family DNA binding protein
MKLLSQYITTTEACELIGVSKTIVKRLADEGTLKTWKTPGGHRRLLRESVFEYVNSLSQEPANSDLAQDVDSFPNAKSFVMTILIVDDDSTTQMLLKKIVESLNLKIEVVCAKNGYEGLLMVGVKRPTMIFADLMMPQMDGYTMLNSIRNLDNELQATIVVVTGQSPERIERSRLPSDIIVMHKPIQADVIKSFIQYEYNLKTR